MRLDIQDLLREEGVVPFQYELEAGDLEFPSISRFLSPLKAQGRVTSQADVLSLTGTVRAALLCHCDRCGAEYQREAVVSLDTTLADEHEDLEDPDVFLLQDGCVELDEIVTTAFVLGLDSKLLCRPDCKGICPRCGQNLNEGSCPCQPETDPRLAVLGQLLESTD